VIPAVSSHDTVGSSLEAAMKTTFAGEVAAAGLPRGSGSSAFVTEEEIAALPQPVQRYLRRMGVLDHPRVWSFRLRCLGCFKPALDAEWREAESWQYNSSLDVARIQHLKLQFYGIPVVGRSVYLRGTGRLIIRPLDLVTAECDAGPAFDRSELMSWLTDAILFAPSMLLGARTEWRDAGEDGFELTFTDSGLSVCARVTLDSRGMPLQLATDLRSQRDPRTRGVRPARWSTPITGWQTVGGHRIPTRTRSVWRLPAGDVAYAELDIAASDVAFNVMPGSVA
jgi:hypothetical protein